MTEPSAPDKLIPEWSLDEDRQIVAVGFVVGLVMLFGVLGYGGLSIVDRIFGGSDSRAVSADHSGSSGLESVSTPTVDLSGVRRLAAANGLDVSFTSSGSTAVLEGVVPTSGDADLLTAAALGSGGVDSVDDRLRVLEPQVADAVTSTVRASEVEADEVTASMDGYSVILDGLVTTESTRLAVAGAASQIDGVKGVEDRMRVFENQIASVAAASPWKIQVVSSARDVSIDGVVPTGADRQDLSAVFESVDGVAELQNRVRVLADEVETLVAGSAPSLDFSLNGYQVDVAGLMPDSASADELVASLRSLDGVDKVNSNLVSLDAAVSDLGLDGLSASLERQVVTMVGVVPTPDDLATASAALADLPGVESVESDGVDVLQDQLTSALALGSLDTVRFEMNGYDVVLSGIVTSQGRADELLAAARGVDGIGEVDSQLTVQATQLEVDLNELVDLDPILFETNSSTIAAGSFPTLDRAVGLLIAAAEGQVTIEGHTDSMGNAEANLALSIDRAQAVADYLVDNGVDRDRLVVAGYGEERPRSTNDTVEGRAANRRIEFRIG